MDFKSTIRQLRDDANISQQDIADKIGIARATYAGLENGRRDPNLTEIRNIAEFYQISPSDLVNGVGLHVDDPTKPYKFEKLPSYIGPRDINPQTNPEKLREVLLYVLEKVGAKPNVGETVLYKLLYFIDFDYYEKTGQSITGLTYIRNHYGPTPSVDFKSVVEGMENTGELERVETKYFNNIQRKYLPTKRANLRDLSADQIKHIDETLTRLSDKTANDLSDLSHKDMPWLVAKQGEKIEYRDVYYRTNLTAVTEPEDEL
jgi:transcriptional regulator with XRE-family HTH domain